MKTKLNYSYTKIFILIIIGLIAFFTPAKYINLIHLFSYIGILIYGLYQMYKSFNSSEININNLILTLIALLLFFIIKNNKSFYMSIIPIIGGIYILIIGLARLFTIFIYKDIPESKIIILLSCIINFIFSSILILNPLSSIETYTRIIGIYLILLGISYLPKRNNIDGFKIIELPTLIQSLKPYNDFIKNNNIEKIDINKENINYDAEILIHVRKSKRGIFGHADLVYNNFVYSYGNYDQRSFKLWDAIGDGVLLKASKKEYINFCKSYGKSLFSFKIKLNKHDKIQMNKRLKSILSKTYIFNKNDIVKNSYIDKLQKRVPVTFYKFNKGYFKNYFFLNYNCVKFIENVISKNLVDFTSIKTPGTLYTYLNNQYNNGSDFVVHKGIY